MKFKRISNEEFKNEMLSLVEGGHGRWWKNNGLGKLYNFNEDEYVVHHINGDDTTSVRDTGETNLALIPSSMHNRFKKANEAEWKKIQSDYKIVSVTAKGRNFLLVLQPEPAQQIKQSRELLKV